MLAAKWTGAQPRTTTQAITSAVHWSVKYDGEPADRPTIPRNFQGDEDAPFVVEQAHGRVTGAVHGGVATIRGHHVRKDGSLYATGSEFKAWFSADELMLANLPGVTEAIAEAVRRYQFLASVAIARGWSE